MTEIAKPKSNYDTNLKTLQLRSKDGFIFGIEVTQVISIAPKDAPKMISRVGSPMAEGKDIAENTEPIHGKSSKAVKYSSIKNLVSRVIEPMVGNYFRNSAQEYGALDFLGGRSEIQQGAIENIKAALTEYGVQAIGTFINEIDLPDELETELKRRKILIEQRKTYEEQTLTQQSHRELIEEQEKTKGQPALVQAQQNL
ncbi:MAG: hypothetical protein F6K47_34415 [Symploca sp. SIO2E6]|nr:hypothetical protein [Symploca sp. SIO2E6]